MSGKILPKTQRKFVIWWRWFNGVNQAYGWLECTDPAYLRWYEVSSLASLLTCASEEPRMWNSCPWSLNLQTWLFPKPDILWWIPVSSQEELPIFITYNTRLMLHWSLWVSPNGIFVYYNSHTSYSHIYAPCEEDWLSTMKCINLCDCTCFEFCIHISGVTLKLWYQ